MALINITGPVTFTGANNFPGNNTFNFPVPAEFSERLSTLETTVQQLAEKLMVTTQQLLDGMKAIDTETTRIATAVADLTTKLADRNISDAEAQSVQAAINVELDKLRPIASNPEVPVPPTA